MRGDGDYTVTGAGNGAKLTLGNGNQTVTLGNWANIITVGNGTSTISAGLGYTTVTAGSGNVTISAHGNGNTFDAGPGTNTMTVDTGTVRNVFKLNGAGQGLTTINGFALNNNDTLNVTRSLAGTNIAANLNNIGSFITATSDQTGTTLYVDPTGGSGTPIAFAFLSNVSVTVSQLVAKGVFSISS